MSARASDNFAHSTGSGPVRKGYRPRLPCSRFVPATPVAVSQRRLSSKLLDGDPARLRRGLLRQRQFEDAIGVLAVTCASSILRQLEAARNLPK